MSLVWRHAMSVHQRVNVLLVREDIIYLEVFVRLVTWGMSV